MKFYELATIVLRENQNKPMTVKEIWNRATKSNYVRYLKSEGKTPTKTLSYILQTNKMFKHTSHRDSRNLLTNRYSLRKNYGIYRLWAEGAKKAQVYDSGTVIFMTTKGGLIKLQKQITNILQ